MQSASAHESVIPFRDAEGEGAIVFDPRVLPQPTPDWFDPAHWREAASLVEEGGRGGAWFVDTPQGEAVLRRYRRGGWMARFSRDAYLWREETGVRSFAEFRLLQQLRDAHDLPVPMPWAAMYRRDGLHYRAAILLQRIVGVRSFGALLMQAPESAPWAQVGELIARFHAVGLDHADLNAHNLLFDDTARGWMIDFDKCRLRTQERHWQQDNLARLRRSLDKLAPVGSEAVIESGFAQLLKIYEATMQERSS